MNTFKRLLVCAFALASFAGQAYEQIPVDTDLVYKAVKNLKSLSAQEIEAVYFQDSTWGVFSQELKDFYNISSEQSPEGYELMKTHFSAIWYDQFSVHDFHHIRGLVFGCQADSFYYTGVPSADELSKSQPEGTQYLVCTYQPTHTGPRSLNTYNGPLGTFSHGAWYYLIFKSDASLLAITRLPQG